MYAIDHKDLGTPPSPETSRVTLEVDGAVVTVPAGTSVMRAAALAGARIPKLCATDVLKAFGSCRLCLIEIEGRKGFPASCTTEVAEGMKVRTRSERLDGLRRSVVELYVSDHPLDCDTCPANGHCELQNAAAELGVTHSPYAPGATQRGAPKDGSNPYFAFDPDLCIVCSRCVRACDEVQGTFALTIEGRGFASRVSASQHEPFVQSECVSCGACVEACPTAALSEKSLAILGQPTRSTTTTCAYCGVGCSLEAETRDDAVVRMVPNRAGRANQGHACVKGRFAYGYATHEDRVRTPLIRERITDDWREATWDEAIEHTAREFRRLQQTCGKHSIGGITSSRCTNEETYLVQKLVRAGFGNNNVDTCARVCHSPTGYGLKHTLGESAGTQEFASVMKADVIMVIGANPTEGHPVFASQLKRRLRQGAKLIIADPRVIGLVRAPHVEAHHHLQLQPGTNVALVNAMAHVVVTEGLTKADYVASRCEADSFAKWAAFISQPQNSPEATEAITGVPASEVRAAARTYAAGPNSAIYYGLGVTEHSQGTTMVMGIANLAMATGNLGREGVGVSPLRGQNNVQGACDMGSFPHEFTGYRHVSDEATRRLFEGAWGVTLEAEPGLRIPNMFEAALDGSFRGLYVQGEDLAQSDPNTQHVTAALRAMECVVVQDLFLNETARFAHVFLPGSSFLEKDGTFTNAERRISRVRKVMEPLAGLADWEVTARLANALGYEMSYSHPSEIMDEIARLTPTFHGVTYAKLDRLGSIQWPCNEKAPEGTPTMHVGQFVRGKGKFYLTAYVPTSERASRRYPLVLTTGRVLTQYNVGAQTRRTANVVWYAEDRLEIHPHDAEVRGIADGDWVGVTSRAGGTVLRATVTDRVAHGVVYTTFHFPESGANLVTTENSDWATNCPEYKVTAVQVVRLDHPDAWRGRHRMQRAVPEPAA
ncbi:MAG TPA: formate dehydrogenase subunit alpha [Steroidobacteraceae bacterium]|nr:formate dehydrogenase subunit alpha [Steroidobacteraceae bacterium]